MFINIKSEYNFLESINRVDSIINYAVDNNLSYIGICEKANTFGFYDFYEKCIAANIKPVMGIEIDYKGQIYYIYAKNYNGLSKLYEINSNYLNDNIINLSNKIDDILIVLGKGIIIDGILNNDYSLYNRAFDVYKDDLYIGYFSHINTVNNYGLYNLCKDKFNGVLIDPIYCLKRDEFESYLTLIAIDKGLLYQDILGFKNKYLDDCASNLDDILDYKNSLDLFVSKIDIKMPESKIVSPKFLLDTKNDLSNEEFLSKLAYKGLNKRLGNNVSTVYLNRLKMELDVIISMGFVDYFLVVWDIVKFAKTNNIYVGAARGSAGGSLVAFCTGITDIDPIEYGLLFERFLNKERASMPDIDIDVEDRFRGAVVDYVVNKYGRSKACKIGTVSKFLVKSAFKDVAKVWRMEPDKIKLVLSYLDSSLSMADNISQNKKLVNLLLGNDLLEKVLDIVVVLENLPRQSSTHAAGVVLANDSLFNYCSVVNNISQLEAKYLEKQGLIKIDILALSNLTFIHDIVNRIKLYDNSFSLNNINYNDKKTYDLISTGNTLGIFQLESMGMRNTLVKVKPNRFSDIANVIALYRPGPKEFIDNYAKYKDTYKPNNKVDYLLKDSAGIILFQEQIMQIAHLVANYDLKQADILRRAISKKDKSLLLEQRNDFVRDSVNNGYDINFASDIFDRIAKFANYGFNKAHAYGYATIVYEMAFLKANFPKVFYGELFYYNFKSDKRELFLRELYSQNINILTPDILVSDEKFSVEQQGIRMGFELINQVGISLAKEIIYQRQFIEDKNDIHDVIANLILKININNTQLKNLIHAGCFDRFNENRKEVENIIFSNFNSDYDSLDILKRMSQSDLKNNDDYSLEELSKLEYKALNINLKYNMFTDKLEFISKKYNQNLNLLDNLNGEYLKPRFVLIKLSSIKEIKTKKGDDMAFLNVKSIENNEIILFPKDYAANIDVLKKGIDKYFVVEVFIRDNNFILNKIELSYI